MLLYKKAIKLVVRYALGTLKLIQLGCKTLLLIVIGEKLHTPVFSPIRSLSDLNAALGYNYGRSYLIKSFQYGSQINDAIPIQCHIFRRYSFLAIRVTYFKYFDGAVSNFIRKNMIRQNFFIHEPVFILPYYNTHFGHYTGELLGQIVMYESLMKRNSERKLLIVRGGGDSDIYIDKFCSKYNIKYVESDLMLSSDLYLGNAVCLPLVHPWQGINFLKNKIIRSFVHASEKVEGVFLTTGRRSRIVNVDDVISFFEAKGFVIIRSKDTFTEQILSLIKDAKVCVTEDATISHFVMLHRTMKYYTLSPKSSKFSGSEYFGGYVFNEFDAPRRIPIECEIISTGKHIMSSQIRVNIDRLADVIFEP